MKKAVLKLDIHDDKAKTKAMVTVSGFAGVESVSIEMKDKKLTVTGDIDPVYIVVKLRKLCHTEIITVGPAKEPEKKKEEPEKKDPADPVKKAVLKLDLHGDKAKKKALKTVSGVPGVESMSIEMKDKKLTVTGEIDAVNIVIELRKLCHTEIITVGPAKEPEKKKEEPKKEEPKKKKEEPKKEEPKKKKEEPKKKKEEPKKEEPKKKKEEPKKEEPKKKKEEPKKKKKEGSS